VISRFAPAKVNLFLHVTGKRADGYHLLDSLAVFPDVGDVVSVADAEALSLEIAGAFGGVLRAEADNLLLRVAKLLAPARGVALRLEKNLPVASGIGGGSADAAAVLRLLAELWGLEDVDLAPLALTLGADVPVCLVSRPIRMRGVGEILVPAPALPEFGMVLVNPGVGVPTPAVFKARRGAFSPAPVLPERWAGFEDMIGDLAACTNDLEAAAIGIAPVIGEVLEALKALPGAGLARMSGSGATCFALFASAAEARAAAASLNRPEWWSWGGGLYQPGKARL
jgi:4-diphosphocytidyl-2-C-methyl-D-erythritol kinase